MNEISQVKNLDDIGCELLAAADKLLLVVLKNKVEKFLIENLRLSSILDVIDSADRVRMGAKRSPNAISLKCPLLKNTTLLTARSQGIENTALDRAVRLGSVRIDLGILGFSNRITCYDKKKFSLPRKMDQSQIHSNLDLWRLFK